MGLKELLAVGLGDAVELAAPEVAATDVGEDGPSVGIDGDQRRFQGIDALAAPAVELLEDFAGSLAGQILLADGEGGEEVVAAAAQTSESETVAGLGGHGVREVRGRPDAETHRRGQHGSGQGPFERAGVDPLQLGHAAQHLVAPPAGAAGTRHRRVNGRRLDHSGEGGGLRQGQLGGVLAEVSPGRGAEAVVVEAVGAAQIDRVEVALKDASLGMLNLDGDGDDGLADLAEDPPVLGEEDVLDELLGKRAATLGGPAPAQIDHQGAGDAGGGHAGVPVERVVLGGQHGLNDVLRKILHPQGPLLSYPLVVVGGEDQRVKRGRVGRPAVDAHRRDEAVTEVNHHELTRNGTLWGLVAPKPHHQDVVAEVVAAGGKDVLVPRPVALRRELVGEALGRHLLPDPDLLGQGIKARRRVFRPGANVAKRSEVGKQQPDGKDQEDGHAGGDNVERPAQPGVRAHQPAPSRQPAAKSASGPGGRRGLAHDAPDDATVGSPRLS